MVKIHNHKLIVSGIIILTLVTAYLLPFSLYGQDGYHLWFPVIAEYLQGDQVYHSSAVIFNGQNLGAIYGELPFWKIFRLLGLKLVPFLNLTHAIFCLMLFGSFLTILKGHKKTVQFLDYIFIILLAFFSPVVLNRVMAGHLNLLYGLLPFFSFLSLIYDKSLRNQFLTFCAFWFALSTQSYQILSYYIFYIPLLVTVVIEQEKEIKKLSLISTGLFGGAFLINLPQFIMMYHHATDPNNLRDISSNLVYSYLISEPMDIFHFFFNNNIELFSYRHFGFFHEVNHAMGGFLLIFAMARTSQKIKAAAYITLLGLFLFSMNFPFFNLLAELPVIKAFRVPQRSLMLLALFIPLWTYVSFKIEWNKRDTWILAISLVISQLNPQVGVACLIMTLILVAFKKNMQTEAKRNFLNKVILIISLIPCMVNLKEKVAPGPIYQGNYERIKNKLEPLFNGFSRQERRQKTFHFETPDAFYLTIVAQTMGVRFVEGYGHPPAQLIRTLEASSGLRIPPSTNHLFISYGTDNRSDTLDVFGVDYVIRYEGQNLKLDKVK